MEKKKIQIPKPNPSFSSTLLESIYRSIDDSGTEKPEPFTDMSTTFYRRNKDHKVSKSAVLSNSNSNSSSSSSESSFWSGGLSSSDSEPAHYFYGPKPKPIRTDRSSSHRSAQILGIYNNKETLSSHQNQDKAKMMSKIYNELKKVKKQPISPGGKLSSFLNSLFAGHPKKPKSAKLGFEDPVSKLKPAKLGFEDPVSKPKPAKFGFEDSVSKPKPAKLGFEDPVSKPKPAKLGFQDPVSYKSSSSNVSTPNCSSASSYTRSCLSKNPNSSKLSRTGSKRSVRFFPVSEDSQPCGQKKLLHEDEELKVVRVMEENRKVAEAARKLLESYRKSKKEINYGNISVELSDDEDDDDAMSCSSSDLFELNNLSDIGTGRYSEELPVYETTHLDTNRAIANGLIV